MTKSSLAEADVLEAVAGEALALSLFSQFWFWFYSVVSNLQLLDLFWSQLQLHCYSYLEDAEGLLAVVGRRPKRVLVTVRT